MYSMGKGRNLERKLCSSVAPVSDQQFNGVGDGTAVEFGILVLIWVGVGNGVMIAVFVGNFVVGLGSTRTVLIWVGSTLIVGSICVSTEHALM